MLFGRLYEDNVSGKIDDARFARYEQEQCENAVRIKALRLELKKPEDKRMDMDTLLETVRRCTDAVTITKRMVAALMPYLQVYPAVKEVGVTNQRATIHYNGIRNSWLQIKKNRSPTFKRSMSIPTFSSS